jgi:hypothetical protein
VYFVEEQGQDYGGGKAEENIEDANGKGVPDKPEKVRILKKVDKMLHPHPGASGHTQVRPKVLKGD